MATSGDGNHCDPCFILDKVKVDSSSMCRECRHQLCDGCVEHHRRTLATRHHNIIPFQYQETVLTQVNEQQLNQRDQSGKKLKSDFIATPSTQVTGQQPDQADKRVTKVKSDALTNVSKSRIRTDKHSTFQVSGRSGQRDTSARGNSGQYEVSGKRERDKDLATGSDTVDQDQAGLMGDGRRVQYEDQATGSDSVDQNQAVKGMKNMILDVGTSNTQTTRQTEKPYTSAKLKHCWNVETENDEYDCDITGLVVLQDKLIVCDFNNSKLKVYNSSYMFLYEYKCDDAPYDIDMLDVNTVVVSYTGCNMRLLSVGNDSMNEISKINTRYGCYGVCCYEGKIYCVVRGSKLRVIDFSEVRAYTPDGTLEHKFKKMLSGKVGCDYLQFITVNPQTGILYVTDWYKGVAVMPTSGDVIAVVPTPQLRNPRGIAVDDRGHIYVCGVWSHNVIQMSSDCRSVVEVLSGEDKCEFPRCMKIYENKMFVAHEDPESYNYIVSIYQLS